MKTIEKPYERVLAIDGGGSKTIAWIANAFPTSDQRRPTFEVIGRSESGPSNPRSVGFEAAFSSLDAAVTAALNQAAIPPTSIAVACLSLAGAGRTEEQNRILVWASNRRLAAQTIVTDDVEPLRFAAEYEQRELQARSSSYDHAAWEQSITLVVGTGSIACGRNGDLLTARVGGWGYLLGDEGSGFAIGLAGLRAVCQAHDRGAPATNLHNAILKHFGLQTPTELVGLVYQNPLPRPQIAAISELVLSHADEDPIARKIMADSIEALADLVTTTAQRVKLSQQSYSLALSGGVLSNQASFVEQLLDELSRRRQSPIHSHLIRKPIHGPLMMAIQTLKVTQS